MGTAAHRAREAIAIVDRRSFLPEAQVRSAHHDMPLPIGHGATCSQPTTVEAMLQLLDPRPGHRVLDVGSGSGWTTALLAHLVGAEGEVVGVEIEPALVELGRAHLRAWARARADRQPAAPARIDQAQAGRLGDPEHAPYDRILVSADAHCVPEALTAQLAEGGRMVLPVRSRMAVVDKGAEGITVREFGSFSFVPLREG